MTTHRTSNRSIPLTVAIVLSLAPLADAACNEAIGTIVRSSRATVSGVPIPDGGNLIADDLVRTEKGGDASVRFSAETQARLSEDTSVRFDSFDGQVSARLSSGTIAAESSGKCPLTVETQKFRVEPAEVKATYVVALLGANTALVSARQGDLSVTEMKSGTKHLVRAGHYARISNAPAPTPPQVSTGAAAAPAGLLNDTPLVFAISVGAGFGIGFGIGEGPLGAGPASPSHP